MYENDLIFGRDKTLGIVAIEAQEETVTIFQQQKDGTILETEADNIYWILSNKQLDSKWFKLDGNLHYQYARTFRDRNTFFKCKQYLKSKNIDYYSVGDSKEAIMLRNGYTYFKGMEVKDVSVLSFDLETTGLKHDDDSKILLISCTYRNSHGRVQKTLFCYDHFKSQGEMLIAFCKFITTQNPSIILGHNILGFDLPYMKYIADKENVTLDMGRDGSELEFDKYESKFRKDGSQSYNYRKVHCYGRNVIDTLFLSIKYDATERKFESYGLKNIIKQLGMEKKDRVYYDASKIRTNYRIPEEWKKIKQYCADDSDEALALFDLMAPPFFYSTQSIPKSFQAVIETATGSQINSIMTRAYLQEKHSIPKGEEASHYEGAVSFAIPGVYRNLFKIDFSALYPSIIRQYKLYDKDKDPKAYFLKMVEYFATERTKNKILYEQTKKEYYNHLQLTLKIFANSCYGFLGAPKLNFNSFKTAAKITEIGRGLLNEAIVWATDKDTKHWVDQVK
jgi:DNA polymerase elongation subunit (family B)